MFLVLKYIPINLEIFNATFLMCSVDVNCLFKILHEKIKLFIFLIAVLSMSSTGLYIYLLELWKIKHFVFPIF